MNLKVKLHAQTCEPMARAKAPKAAGAKSAHYCKLSRRIALGGFVLASCCLSIKAEEQISFTQFEAQAMSAISFFAQSHFASFTLSLAPEPNRLPLGELFHLTDEWRLKSLFQNLTLPGALEHDRSITLFRKQMPSRYSYHAWAGLGTGYGQFFPSDTFGRSRTNGVGVKDPDWLYFKMSLRF